MTVCPHAVNRFLEPFTECAHSVRVRTDTTLDHDCGTEGNCAGMYSVHDRVIFDNMYEFQHSSSPRRLHLFRCKIRESNAEVPSNKETEKARLPTDSCLNSSMHRGVLLS